MTVTTAEQNKRLVIDHFEDLVNKHDLTAIERNLSADFYDHDGPNGQTDRASEHALIARLHTAMPDLKVEVRSIVAEGDLVVVRNVWAGTNASTHQRIEFHGFVLWRIADGKIVERWATVTPPAEFTTPEFKW